MQGRLKQTCEGVEISLEYKDGAQQIILNGENVTSPIRTEEVGNMASSTSVYAPVRRKLVELQRKLAQRKDVVMDGRDIGTCVLPDANLKGLPDGRRPCQGHPPLQRTAGKNVDCNLEEIEKDIIEEGLPRHAPGNCAACTG